MRRFITFLFVPLLIIELQAGDIIVSAQKFERNYLKSTSSIYVLEREDIEELNATNLAEVLKRKGGFSVQTNGAYAKASSINFRGTDNRHTLVLIDGVRVTDVTSIAGGTRLEFIDPAQIERIEILKGNQGVLYGSEAVGGVISITTRKGADALIGLSYGSNKQKRIFAYNSISKGDNQLNISGSHQEIEGISAYNEKRILGEAEKDGVTQTDLLLKWSNESIEKVKMSSQFEIKNSDFLYDDSDGDNADLNGEYQTTRFSGTINYLYSRWINTDFTYSHFKVNRELFGGNSYGRFNYIYEGSFNRYTLLNRSFYGDDGELIVGVEYERESTKALDQVLDTKRSKERIGAYINNYNVFGAFILEEGIRYEKLQFFGNEFVYRVGSAFQLNNLTLKANYATSFKAPSLYQSFAQFGGNRHLEMERSNSKEVSLLYKRKYLMNEVTYFEIDYSNYIDYDQNRNIYTNSGDYKTYGIEYSASISRSSWEAKLSYTFLRSKNMLTGETLPRRSKHNLGFNISYIFNDNWSLMSDLQYRGNRIDSNQKKLVSYHLTNIAIDYKLSKQSHKLSLSIKNLFNKDYEEVWGYGTLGRNFLFSYVVKL